MLLAFVGLHLFSTQVLSVELVVVRSFGLNFRAAGPEEFCSILAACRLRLRGKTLPDCLIGALGDLRQNL